MRVNGLDEQPLELLDSDNPGLAVVTVPGFGHLLVMLDPAHANAGTAIVTRGPGTEQQREVTRVDGRIRLDVVVVP